MLTQQAALDQVKQFAAEARKLPLHLRKVILFGSYARNQQHANSDLDVALVADEFVGVPFEDLKHLAPLLTKYLDLQAHTFPTAEFTEGNPFVQEIIRTGKIID